MDLYVHKDDVGAKKVMKTHQKVPEKCHFSPIGLNCSSETPNVIIVFCTGWF